MYLNKLKILNLKKIFFRIINMIILYINYYLLMNKLMIYFSFEICKCRRAKIKWGKNNYNLMNR